MMDRYIKWADGITENMSTSETTGLFTALLMSLFLNAGLILIIGLGL